MRKRETYAVPLISARGRWSFRQWLLKKITGGSIHVVVIGNLRTGTNAIVYLAEPNGLANTVEYEDE